MLQAAQTLVSDEVNTTQRTVKDISSPGWKCPRKLQSILTHKIVEKKAASFGHSFSRQEKSRVQGGQYSEAAGWLKALPCDSSLYMANSVFSIRMCRRLGLPLSHLQVPNKCVCLSRLDAQASHVDWCPKGSEHIWAHNAVVNDMKAMINMAGLHAESEVGTQSVFPQAGERQFRADLFICGGLQDRAVVGDVTIRNRLIPSNSRSGSVLVRAEEDKSRRYSQLCKDAGHNLNTYAFDQLGQFSPDVHSLISELGERVKDLKINWNGRFNWSAPTFQVYWRQRLSCTLQRAVAIKELCKIQASRRASFVNSRSLDMRDMYRRNYMSSSSRR